MVLQALTVGATLFGALESNRIGRKQQRLLNERAGLEEEALKFDLSQKEREFEHLLGRQKSSIAKSGIKLAGSPLEVLEETRKDKETSLRNIMRDGYARADRLRAEGRIAKRKGRTGAITSILSIGGQFG